MHSFCRSELTLLLAFLTFLLRVLVTHTSIGLEDIHPPAFYELLDEIRTQYYEKLNAGEVDLETEPYGCNNTVVTQSGELKTVQEAASDTVRLDKETMGKLGEEKACGAKKGRRRQGRRGGGRSGGSSKGFQSNVPKRRPLLKGAKMIDGRTKAGKEAKERHEKRTPRELAARAALARFGKTSSKDDNDENQDGGDNGSSSSEEEEERIVPHLSQCGCRSCVWDSLLI